MTSAYAEMLRHVGLWTEADYLQLPDDGLRIELVDGALLVNPPPNTSHQRLNTRLWRALDDAVPPGFEVLDGVGVRVAEGRILIPDLSVVTKPGTAPIVWEAADVALVVEITSPGSIVNDKAIKPVAYAAAGIPYFLQIDLRTATPRAVLHKLLRLDYAEILRNEPGEPLRLAEPFPVIIDLAALAVAVRPAQD
jgi:Uma2 family endonuclease